MLIAVSDLENVSSSSYHVILGKTADPILSPLEKETGLLYFLSKDDEILAISDPAMDPGFISVHEESGGDPFAPLLFPNGKSHLVSNISLQPGSDLNL